MYAADGNHVVLRGGGGKDTINLEMLYNSGKAAAFGDAGNDKLVGLFDYEYPNPCRTSRCMAEREEMYSKATPDLWKAGAAMTFSTA